MLGIWSYLFWPLIIGGGLISVLVLGIPFYLWLGSQTLDMVNDLGQKQAKLVCWHCGQETSSERKQCQHCGKELR